MSSIHNQTLGRRNEPHVPTGSRLASDIYDRQEVSLRLHTKRPFVNPNSTFALSLKVRSPSFSLLPFSFPRFHLIRPSFRLFELDPISLTQIPENGFAGRLPLSRALPLLRSILAPYAAAHEEESYSSGRVDFERYSSIREGSRIVFDTSSPNICPRGCQSLAIRKQR